MCSIVVRVVVRVCREVGGSWWRRGMLGWVALELGVVVRVV